MAISSLPILHGSQMTSADIYNEDCISGMGSRLTPASVDLTVTSIPFEELFTYSGKMEDVGNNGSTVNLREGRFALNLRFFIQALFRVTKPGCNACIHIQQLLAYKNQHGFIGRRDFRGAVIDLFSKHGWEWKGEFVICKNPQAMAQRLNLHCLMFATGKRNGRDLAPAPNDYVLVFQRPGESSPSPCLRDGDTNPEGWITTDEWIRDAHGVWGDIDEFDVLDGARSAHLKESDQEKHVCPLQLEVIRRLIRLYTSPGELVLDPFMGIGSTAWTALGAPSPSTKLAAGAARSVVGFELKESYHRTAQANVERARAAVEDAARDLFTTTTI